MQSYSEPISKENNIIVIGNRGMLGQDLYVRLQQSLYNVVGLDIPEIDITKPVDLRSRLKDCNPRVIINCAAYTAVDRAESEPDIAFLVNRDGTANLAEVCKIFGIPLIHISTDYVFDGMVRRPYREDDEANPMGVYGTSKWEGEVAVRSRLTEHLIVRTAWLYGLHGPNFVKTMLRLGGENETIRVVADQFGCPTWSEDLAEALTQMIRTILQRQTPLSWGTYHYCGKGQTTWHSFAEAIIEEGRAHQKLKAREVIPIATEDYPTPARRPGNSVLDCSKTTRNFGIEARPWRESLKAYLSKAFARK